MNPATITHCGSHQSVPSHTPRKSQGLQEKTNLVTVAVCHALARRFTRRDVHHTVPLQHHLVSCLRNELGSRIVACIGFVRPFPRQSLVQPCALGADHFARACVRQRYRRLPHTFDKNIKTPVPALASPTPQKSWTVAARLVIRAFHFFTNMIFRHMASWGVQGPTSGRMRYLVSRIQPMRGAAPLVPHPSC